MTSASEQGQGGLDQALLSHMARLSSREFEGRQATTYGDWAAGLYVAEKFSKEGLKPLPGLLWEETTKAPIILEEGWRRFFQPFPMPFHRLENPLALTARIGEELYQARPGTDYLPFVDSPEAEISAPLIFVGYGISQEKSGHDDYKRVDAEGKVVLFMRGSPKVIKEHYSYGDKLRIARRKGAVGALAITGPAVAGFEQRMGLGTRLTAAFSSIPGEDNLPAFLIVPQTADRLLKKSGLTLTALQNLIDSGKQAASVNLDVSVTMKVKKSFTAVASAANVIAFAQGSSLKAAEEFVVVGAHRDAFGLQADTFLFPGADDNASGAAVLLELAAMMKEMAPLKRSVIFASFSGEESGLLGAQHFVARLPFAANKIVAMLNIDGVGVGNGKITLGLHKIDRALIERAKKASRITRELQIAGYFPGGDHVPFAEKGVPTIAITTSGAHADLHQVTDTVEKIDGGLAADVARLAVKIIHELDNEVSSMR